MAGRYKGQDWLDRCYIALERDKDMRMEEALAKRKPEQRPGRKPRKLTGEELRKATKKQLKKLYGKWPVEGVVPLPERTIWENQVDRAVYNTVYAHNRRAKERMGT